VDLDGGGSGGSVLGGCICGLGSAVGMLLSVGRGGGNTREVIEARF